ncbi:MAG TPA: hypothetical protein G4N96_02260 [Chloroflexi bacterium]|nr:hypothetical protein [Chloroflexota bacterium]
MLHQVLNEFKSAQGALNLSDLARKLKVEQSALDGMIQFWVRKGRIEDSQLANSPALSAVKGAAPSACSGLSCAGSCPGPQGCPYVMEMPRILSYVKK